jgi:hypothetical protein
MAWCLINKAQEQLYLLLYPYRHGEKTELEILTDYKFSTSLNTKNGFWYAVSMHEYVCASLARERLN